MVESLNKTTTELQEVTNKTIQLKQYVISIRDRHLKKKYEDILNEKTELNGIVKDLEQAVDKQN